METELGRVVQHQDQRAASSDAVAGGLKMSTLNLRLADARIGEKAIRRFGVRPILPRPRQASADSLRDLLQQLPQSLAMSPIAKAALS